MLLSLALLALPAAAQDPLDGQLPKRDLRVDVFLAEFPEYDGRGIRVGVLDTGIDPGHPLLQRTSTGARKLVDWYDATSDGRLQTDFTATAPEGVLTGLSGRRLELGRWAAPDRSDHLGRIDRDFLPGGLAGRISAARREKWEKAKQAWEEEQARRAAEGAAATNGHADAALQQDEEQRRWKSFDDPGPVYDVLVFHEDDGWRVVVDSDEDGDLGEERALRPFRESGDWAVLGDEALLHYAVQVAPDGNAAWIFFDANGHGTHVAGIIGAYGGPAERLNGLAPGVELVAIKIGDGKYGGATSGFSIAKALDYALEAGCHAVNISFGGSSFFADGAEPDARVIAEATRRGLIVICSAGNDGPALSTVGAPATSPYAIAVAAAVWPDTQRVNYGALRPVSPVLFDFSSRGPQPNGDLGVDFTAPGAALSTLPSWLITPAENFNGTSMAAPQVAGAVALLLSGAQAEGLRHSPGLVHRAMRQGAARLPGFALVEQGYGAVRVPESFRALRELERSGVENRRYEVEVRNPYGTGSGIYERDLPASRPFERRVRITPVFAEDASNAAKATFLRTFRLQAEQAWITVPDAFYTSAAGHAFAVGVDPARLEPGLHSGSILVFDADRPSSLGAEIVIPVTVVVPWETDAAGGHRLRRAFELDPGQVERTFARVPYGAQQVKITLRQSGAGRNEFRTGAGSVSGLRYSGDRQARGRIFLGDADRSTATVPVEPGTVFEYAVASRWAVNRPARLELELEFQGLVPQARTLIVPAGQGLAYLGVKSPLRQENVSVSATVEGAAYPVTAAMHIEADPIRETVLGGRGMFYGVIEWPVEIPAGGSRAVLHTPASIQTTEYREDLMVDVFDENGQRVHRQIVSEVDTDLGRLAEGAYRFRLAFPSLGKVALERRYAGAELRLPGPNRPLTVYNDLEAALQGGRPSGSLALPFMGARTVAAMVPELPALDDGAYYYGTVKFQSGSDTLLELPLRVARPTTGTPAAAAPASLAAGEAAAADGPDEGGEPKPGPAELARTEFQQLAEAGGAGAAEMLEKARAWEQAAPRSPAAALAVLESLAAAGYPDRARQLGADYLRRFPLETGPFLAAAGAWN